MPCENLLLLFRFILILNKNFPFTYYFESQVGRFASLRNDWDLDSFLYNSLDFFLSNKAAHFDF